MKPFVPKTTIPPLDHHRLYGHGRPKGTNGKALCVWLGVCHFLHGGKVQDDYDAIMIYIYIIYIYIYILIDMKLFGTYLKISLYAYMKSSLIMIYLKDAERSCQ